MKFSDVTIIGPEGTADKVENGQPLNAGFKKMVSNELETGNRVRMWNKIQVVIFGKKKVLLSHYQPADDLVVTYVVGVADSILIALAKMKDGLGFPRGFPIAWNPKTNRYIWHGGFLSKFSNDERNDTAFSLDGLRTLKLAKKFSGSLGLLTAFVYKDVPYLFFGAKNSTGNYYTSVFHSMLMDWYSGKGNKGQELVEFLCKGHTIAFEVCSNDDAMGHHGSTYATSLPVALVIGKMEEDNIIRFLDDDESMAIFHKLELPVEHRWFVEDMARFEGVLDELYEMRDFITNAKFDVWAAKAVESGILRCLPGTIEHSMLSNVLEGLIIWLYRDGVDKPEINKFKFANYTRMTMCLREMMTPQRHGYQSSAPLLQPGQPICKWRVAESVKRWADYWVVNPENRPRHISILLRAIEILSEMPETEVTSNNYLHFAEPAIEQAELESPVIDADSWIGESFKGGLVIGNVGSGKSSFLHQLNALGAHTISVDDLHENTGGKGRTKHNHAFGSFIKGCMDGKFAFIENGGGLFYNDRNGFQILKELRRRSPAPVEIGVVVAPVSIVEFALNGGDKEALVAQLLDETRDAVQSRLDRGEYQIVKGNTQDLGKFQSEKKMFGTFKGVTSGNLEFQLGVLDWAQKHGVPIVGFQAVPRPDERPLIELSDAGLVHGLIHTGNPVIDPTHVKFTHGLMAKCSANRGEWFGHITYGFGSSYNEVCTHELAMDGVDGTELEATVIKILKKGNPKGSKRNRKDQTFIAVSIDDTDAIALPEFAHMTIDAPYRPMHNKTVCAEALIHPVNEPFEMEIDRVVYTVTRTDEKTMVHITRPYSYVLP